MEIHDDKHFVFDDGRLLYAHNHIVGINPDLEVYDGYDGDIDTHPWFEKIPAEECKKHLESIGIDYDKEYLSFMQRVELADYMISLWNQYKQKYQRTLANNALHGDPNRVAREEIKLSTFAISGESDSELCRSASREDKMNRYFTRDQEVTPCCKKDEQDRDVEVTDKIRSSDVEGRER